MFLHAGEGIKIVERYIVTVKVQIRTSGAIMWRGRGRIRAPIRAFRAPISSVADWRIVRKAWACGMEASASTSAHEETSVYFIGRSYTDRRSFLNALSWMP